MAEKRKARKKKEEIDEKPSKEEYAVAKYLRSHLPNKKTTLFSHKVEYFIASKAVVCLLDSPWATNQKSQEALFTTRESVVEYLNRMLIHKFFHRAKKIQVSQKEVKQKKKSVKDREDESSHAEDTKDKKTSSKRKEREKTKEPEKSSKDGEEKKDGTMGDAGKEKKKEKRKIKLDMHLEQIFVDGNEAYVWIYDPIPTTAWLIGGLLVVGTILLCLFPLWPSSVRKGVYYISIAAAGFLCNIVALIIVRIIIFCLIWLLTFGRHHLWILPNLTEDVGFFESFWPLFKYEYKGAGGSTDSEDKEEEEKKKEKDDKESDEEDEKKSKALSETDKDNTERESDRDHTDTDRESEESGEQQCLNSTADNGFEMVNQDELDENSVNDAAAATDKKGS